jgi:hypothetical protein
MSKYTKAELAAMMAPILDPAGKIVPGDEDLEAAKRDRTVEKTDGELCRLAQARRLMRFVADKPDLAAALGVSLQRF